MDACYIKGVAFTYPGNTVFMITVLKCSHVATVVFIKVFLCTYNCVDFVYCISIFIFVVCCLQKYSGDSFIVVCLEITVIPRVSPTVYSIQQCSHSKSVGLATLWLGQFVMKQFVVLGLS